MVRISSLILSGFCLFFAGSCTAAEEIDQLYQIQASSKHAFIKPRIVLTGEEVSFFKEITDLLKLSTFGFGLLKSAEKINYQFGGFLDHASDAITIPSLRVIKISKGQSIKEAALDLAYELCNVIHSARYCEIIHNAKSGAIQREEYATRIINLEAEGVYGRSVVAGELNLQHLDPFHTVVYTMDEGLSHLDKIAYIAQDIITSGTVVCSSGRESVREYYMRQCDGLIAK